MAWSAGAGSKSGHVGYANVGLGEGRRGVGLAGVVGLLFYVFFLFFLLFQIELLFKCMLYKLTHQYINKEYTPT
jgi:hypothetical protein